MWSPQGVISTAAEVLKENGLTPLHLHAKEGLALINGTQLITSIGAEACTRAANCAKTADVACAMTLEVRVRVRVRNRVRVRSRCGMRHDSRGH